MIFEATRAFIQTFRNYSRASGRTTRLIVDAPKEATLVFSSAGAAGMARRLAKSLEREDLKIVTVSPDLTAGESFDRLLMYAWDSDIRFDHTWIEEYFAIKWDAVENGFKNLTTSLAAHRRPPQRLGEYKNKK